MKEKLDRNNNNNNYYYNAHHTCVCARVCVGGVKDQRECGKKCEKGKVKECERHLSSSVMNNPSAFVHG